MSVGQNLFNVFNSQLKSQIEAMTSSGFPIVEMDLNSFALYGSYLDSFPEGTNKIFRQRREYDCNCCKSYIRSVGNMAMLTPDGIVTIWDNVNVGNYYDIVAKKMSEIVKASAIKGAFLHHEKNVGREPNKDNDSDIIWEHFQAKLPNNLVCKMSEIGTTHGNLNASYDSFKKSMERFTIDAIETVVGLIDSNSIYRGAEFKAVVSDALKAKKEYESYKSEYEKEYFLRHYSITNGVHARYRSTVIGSLIEELSEGKGLESAVASFESKVAPTNYKRTSAVITPKMIKAAQKKIEDLGYLNSLGRRFATPDDISSENLIFANSGTVALNVFDDLSKTAVAKNPNKGAKEISLEDFISKVVPKSNSLELLITNKMKKNLVSMITAIDTNAPSLFKWDNHVSWAYNGDITDSITDKVKKYGGQTDHYLRVSLAWFNSDDLDLAVRDPDGNYAFFGHKGAIPGATLDLDMNGMDKFSDIDPVENFAFHDASKIVDGEYKIYVDSYSKRSSKNEGFTLQVKIGDEIQNFSYPYKFIGRSQHYLSIVVKNGEFSVIKINNDLIDEDVASEEVWGIQTNSFITTEAVFKSPNFWNDNASGNLHYIFALAGCKNPDDATGFFNEFLNPELYEHRKVFESLGASLKAKQSQVQVSGVGFSVTKKDSFIVRATGNTSEIYKVNI